MKYLKKFNAHNEYAAFRRSKDFIRPNVTECLYDYHIHITNFDDRYRYLTFVAEESGAFTFKIGSAVTPDNITSVSYSLDDGDTWITTNNTADTTVIITTPNVNFGDKVLWKGIGVKMVSDVIPPVNEVDTTYTYCYFSSTGNFSIRGNIMSLLYGDNFKDEISLSGITSPFSHIFENCGKLTSAEKLSLPATELWTKSYSYMFQDCTSLTVGPELPATRLTSNCYQGMFYGCSSLTIAPELPATTLASGCYKAMFYQCRNLIEVPSILPATTLSSECYRQMFYGCTSLATAPELPAASLSLNSYWYMFYGCTSLNYIKCLATNISASQCTYDWVRSVASSGTFVKHVNMQDWTTGTSGIPSNWTVQTASS